MTTPNLARIPLAVPDLRGREAELLLKCVKDNWVSSAGPEVVEFERLMAEITGRRHAIAVVNGTAGLHLALLAVGVGPGDHVVVPDWTFAATANAVAHAGACPHFVDVSAEDWALDPGLTRHAIVANPKIKAIIAVDPLGHAFDADRFADRAQHHRLPLVEDAAAAIGGRYRDRPCGSLGDISVFSFNGNKTITAGGGGMVVCDDDNLARVVRHLSTQARPSVDYVHDRVGYNYRMTNVNAAIGLAQLERLDEMVNAKRSIARRYDAALTSRGDVSAMPRPAHSTSTCWLYNVRVRDEAAARSLVARMAEAAIETRIFWRSLSAQPAWRGSLSTLDGTSHALSGSVVSLPCSSSLSHLDQDRVIACLAGWNGPRLADA